ncbi:MAG: hypothetical protein KAT86_04520 [Candidatus Latescibacteria bacterium]|nr:hypothetical protein [Candidatus Latescibacterota bacterium]
MDPKNGNRLFSDKKLMQNVHQGGRSNRVCYQNPFAKNESPRSKLRGILDDLGKNLLVEDGGYIPTVDHRVPRISRLRTTATVWKRRNRFSNWGD